MSALGHEERILGWFRQVLFAWSQSGTPPHHQGRQADVSAIDGATSAWHAAGDLQRRGSQCLDRSSPHYPRPARSQLVARSVIAILDESVVALANRRACEFQTICYLDLAAAIGRGEHEPRSQGHPGSPLRRRAHHSNSA